MGAYVAYEMACQLEVAGESISLLAIIEGYAPATHRTRSSELHWKRFTNVWRNVPFWFQDYVQLGLRGFRQRMRSAISDGAQHFRRSVRAKADMNLGRYIDDDPSQLPAWQRRVMEAQIRALSHYNPKPYNGRISVFRAQYRTVRQALFGTDDPELGWSQLALGGVDVRVCPGSHRNLHMEPHVAGLAEQLRACLDDAAQGDTS
jgi:thioesterase domain-containing protein